MQKEDTSWIIAKIHTCISQYTVRAVWCPSGTEIPLLVRIWEMPHPQLISRQYPFNAHIADLLVHQNKQGALNSRSKLLWDGSRLYGTLSYSFRVYTTIIKHPLIIEEWNIY